MSYDDLFTEALRRFDERCFDEAEALARQIAETAPQNPEVLNLLGLIAQAKGLHKEACSYFAAAIRQGTEKPAFYFNLAFSQKAAGELADALVNFNKVLVLAPQIKETFDEIAGIYETLGNMEKARFYWREALKLDAGYLTAEIHLANSFRTDNPEQAESLLNRLGQRAPEEPLIWYNLAWLSYARQDYASALPLASKAAELAPDADSVRYLLGLIFMAQSNIPEAKKCLMKAEMLNPDNWDAKQNLADIYSRSGEFSEAENRYKRLLEVNPQNFNAHNNYAEMLYRQKRLSEALEEYRRAVILNPKSAEVCNNLGAILKDMKEYDEALGLFFNALNLAPKLGEISVNIAETLIIIAADNMAKAIEIAKNWQKSYPDNPFAVHITAALQGENIENNQIFTEQLFDNFADNYEMVMQNLDYSAPLAIGRIAGPLEGRIADLGCGSGLVGLAVKNNRNQIIGVDISAKMLELAGAKNVYIELVKSDIMDFLNNRSDFNWIIAADVLGYIGSAEQFIRLCRGKNIIFTIETLENSQSFKIQPSGRFKHAPSYIENLLRQNDFYDIFKENVILRTENGKPVNGCIFKAMGEKKCPMN